MACGGCLAKKANANKKFVWTGPSGESQTYNTEIEAKAKKMRSGGTYRAVAK